MIMKTKKTLKILFIRKNYQLFGREMVEWARRLVADYNAVEFLDLVCCRHPKFCKLICALKRIVSASKHHDLDMD